MNNIDDILQKIQSDSTDLALDVLGPDDRRAAQNDVRGFLKRISPALQTWAQELQTGKLTESEFAYLVRNQAELADMSALRTAGLAQVQIDNFVNGVIDITTAVVIAETDSGGPK